MKLTLEKALDISIELWEWIARTGAECKRNWSGWNKYGYMHAGCPLCQYSGNNCDNCPLEKEFGGCEKTPYGRWDHTKSPNDAQAFLEVLKELRAELEPPKQIVYKVVARLADGRLVSPFAGAYSFSTLKEVEYIVGEITKSPTEKGLHIYSTKEGAIGGADKATSGMAYFNKTDDVRVYEAIALGKVVDSRVPALVLGKEVWKPVPTEAEITQGKIRDVASKEKTFSRLNIYRYYDCQHTWREWQEQLDAMVKNGELFTDSKGAYPLYSTNKDAFEPEEVWEDVTAECKAEARWGYICLYHNGGPVASLCIDTPYLETWGKDHNYTIARDRDILYGGGFAILRKVQ